MIKNNWRLHCLHTGFASDSGVFRFFRYSLCADLQRTPLPIISLLLQGYLLLWERGADHTGNTGSCVVIVLFHSNSCPCWLHIPGFQQICHNIMISLYYTLTQLCYGEVAVCVVVFMSGVHWWTPYMKRAAIWYELGTAFWTFDCGYLCRCHSCANVVFLKTVYVFPLLHYIRVFSPTIQYVGHVASQTHFVLFFCFTLIKLVCGN